MNNSSVIRGTAAVSDEWLEAPWARAVMCCIADPAADLDFTMAHGWPEWMPLDKVQTDPFTRIKLGGWLLRGQSDEPSAIIFAGAARRSRLAFLPAPDAVRLMRLAGAWVGASGLTGLLRTTDIAAARAALGEEAVTFASQAALLPRPTTKLMSALGASDIPPAPSALVQCGAAMFGLAIGDIPQMLRTRLGLRRPAPIWATAVENCRDDSAGEDAFHAMRRLVRKRMPTWSRWFN
ncbi:MULTISPECIES: hypothetical protein [unclassified Mesorhizobium]|uniref:hypothetical protein n=1 Tax=unclassified Mesorhizobium TaxID=325217 RepID=UPI000FCC308C|nr:MULTISPECIES: hypothetical protein [unclassified Mesorhizobium]RUV64387.1 hypothetical protein EOA85_02015 [Mesorhizobium sp. M5C.F.Ca.IN.020.29.1.1]RWC25240.1 MAG: hypothetical protein EOS51_01065 [Mesorhizobium sp.]RWD77500.1 MAG: hypothetical protein EOS48_29020 [Mesorhizobium sp.]RWE52600.1 MAG: hypothetical protein EOS67_29880 [Mesorhizobium sp.]RWE96117.1 MAG: hypothetical protein EOS68_18160 [Mesorhizobium sp.]